MTFETIYTDVVPGVLVYQYPPNALLVWRKRLGSETGADGGRVWRIRCRALMTKGNPVLRFINKYRKVRI